MVATARIATAAYIDGFVVFVRWAVSLEIHLNFVKPMQSKEKSTTSSVLIESGDAILPVVHTDLGAYHVRLPRSNVVVYPVCDKHCR